MCKPISTDMTIMTVKNQHTPFSICFVSCQWIKLFSKPFSTMSITCPFLFIVAIAPIYRRIGGNVIPGKVFHFKNDERWKERTICANTFNWCSLLLLTQLRLMIYRVCECFCVDYNFWCFNYVNCETTLIHIIHILCVDIIFFNRIMNSIEIGG